MIKNRAKRSITQKEIARLLNLSTATVSLALSNCEKVKLETRRKVKELAERLNYTPCDIARSLVLQKTWSVGLIIPSFSITYYNEFAEAIQRKFKDKNYLTIILSADASEKRETISILLKRKVDGLILPRIDIDELYWLQQGTIPCVFYEKMEGIDNIDCVYVDKFKGGYKATEHLIKSGYKKIGFLCSTGEDRTKGYIEALIDYGLKVNKEWIVSGFGFFEDGYRNAKEILKVREMPEALVCMNDISAIGAIRGFQEEGVKVPDDIAVVGFDNIKEGRYFTPSLTTVEQPVEEIADKVVEILVDRIEGRDRETRKVVIEPGLIIRESCGCRRKEVMKGKKVRGKTPRLLGADTPLKEGN